MNIDKAHNGDSKLFRNQDQWISNELFLDTWVPHFAGVTKKWDPSEEFNNKFSDSEMTICHFWKMFFRDLLAKDSVNREVNTNDLVDPDTGIIKVSKSIFVKQYRDKVYKLLEDNRNHFPKFGITEMVDLQRKIETLTTSFSEENIYASCPDIISMMVKNDDSLPNAKEFLLRKYKVDRVGDRMTILRKEDEDNLSIEEKKTVHSLLSVADKDLLTVFGQYTIECLLIHTLCVLFHIEHYVSVASLIESIERNIRIHAQIVGDNRMVIEQVPSKVRKKEYPFGTALVEYLISRNVIVITQRNLDDIKSCEMEEGIPKKFVKNVKKKGQSFYREKTNFAECTFNTAILPIKFNLPMVIPPSNWKYDLEENQNQLSIFDLSGGYLTNERGQLYDGYRMLSSSNLQNFYIYFGEIKDRETTEKADRLCESINWLQRQAFKINSSFLEFITKNVDKMVLNGLLMPEFLSNIPMNDAIKLLRECYMNYDAIHSIYKFSELVEILSKNVQQSRYEQTIIDMARAYDGYEFYYPAFLDFRGRIYRSGIFHLHERDFARSLILLAGDTTHIDTSNEVHMKNLRERFLTATAFHLIKYQREIDAYTFLDGLFRECFDREAIRIDNQIISLMEQIAQLKCKNIYQFLANVVFYAYSKDDPMKLKDMYLSVPITQDASASAYQIMSYYLLDATMAMRTNLIKLPNDDIIEDIYEDFLDELRSYLKDSLSSNPSLLKVTDVLTRKIVKGLFMPMIYGKTIGSTINDLKISLSNYIVPKESFILASHIFKFWREKYHSHQVLMKLIPLLGRFVSTVDRPVLYGCKYFSTLQDYRVMSKNSVYVYDKNTRKRRSVTLTISSEKRDKRKTETSTFVNFIHQKDATIAMEMVERMRYLKIPIYTVHDNFISNTANCEELPSMYLHIFKSMGPPLLSINKFIDLNIIRPHGTIHLNLERVIPLPKLRDYLNAWERPKSENKKKWETNIERIINYYSEYCMAVCGSSSGIPGDMPDADVRWDAHVKRYKEFTKSLNGKYCIHH